MINLPSQMQRFLNHCKIRKALNDKTIKAYKIDLRQFAQFTDNKFSVTIQSPTKSIENPQC